MKVGDKVKYANTIAVVVQVQGNESLLSFKGKTEWVKNKNIEHNKI